MRAVKTATESKSKFSSSVAYKVVTVENVIMDSITSQNVKIINRCLYCRDFPQFIFESHMQTH